MDDIDPELLEFAEDLCDGCGAHVGFGARFLHLRRCDEHSGEDDSTDSEDDEDDSTDSEDDAADFGNAV
jgi:hypothetical protein